MGWFAAAGREGCERGMSEGPPAFPEGLPVIFFHEDPEERRQSIEGARPARSSVPLPALDQPGRLELEYPLIQFPWEPWQAGLETQSVARSYAAWLNDIAQDRLATIVASLTRVGAPVGGLRENPVMLAELGGWMQRMFPVLATPMIEQGFLADDPWFRLGWAYRAHSPRSQGYSRHLDALVGSVAHDLAFMVADCVRTVRPGLTWQSFFDTERRSFLVGFDPEQPQADLVGEIADFLTQSVARPRGVRGHELRAWYGRTLLRGYERAVHGAGVPDVGDVFRDARAVRGEPRRDICLPAQRGFVPPPGLVAAVEAFRAAGWFETVKRGSVQLAGAVQASWRFYEGEDLPLDASGLYWRLLMLDSSRTWSDDVEAGVAPGDGIYSHLLEEVSHIRGKALGTLWNGAEDWTIRPGDLLLSFQMRGGKKKLLIPSPGPYLSPALFTGLNDLGLADGPRLWFADCGPPIAVVTRATAAERAALQRSTGLRLDSDPPPWWSSLAPLPDRHQPEPVACPSAHPSGIPGRRVTRRRATERKAAADGSFSTAGERAPAAPSGSRGDAPAGAGRSRRKPRAAGETTAQAVFTHLMRDLVAPAMRELGFTGTGSRGFAYRSGDYEGGFWTQKSRHSTREEVYFWVHLIAVHVPTNSPYWENQLHALIPGDDHLSQWTVRADSPAEPVADHLLNVFRHYGWPAILAALDSPGYPPDPQTVWPRSFTPQPSPAELGSTSPNL